MLAVMNGLRITLVLFVTLLDMTFLVRAQFLFCIMVLCYPGFIIDKQMGQLTFPYQRPRQNHCTITVSNAHVGTCHWKSAVLPDTLTLLRCTLIQLSSAKSVSLQLNVLFQYYYPTYGDTNNYSSLQRRRSKTGWRSYRE